MSGENSLLAALTRHSKAQPCRHFLINREKSGTCSTSTLLNTYISRTPGFFVVSTSRRFLHVLAVNYDWCEKEKGTA